MGAQVSGNRDLEVTRALLKGEGPSGNIEAGVGFNKITDDVDRARSQRKPMAQPQEQFPGPVPKTDEQRLQEELALDPNLGQVAR